MARTTGVFHHKQFLSNVFQCPPTLSFFSCYGGWCMTDEIKTLQNKPKSTLKSMLHSCPPVPTLIVVSFLFDVNTRIQYRRFCFHRDFAARSTPFFGGEQTKVRGPTSLHATLPFAWVDSSESWNTYGVRREDLQVSRRPSFGDCLVPAATRMSGGTSQQANTTHVWDSQQGESVVQRKVRCELESLCLCSTSKFKKIEML